MSAKVAAAPPLVTFVLSLTLKTRDSFLPAMVKVLALLSTAETVPRNGTARGAFSFGEAAVEALAEADGEALGLGEAFFDVFVAASAEVCPARAIAAMQTAVRRQDLDFIVLVGSGLQTAAGPP